MDTFICINPCIHITYVHGGVRELDPSKSPSANLKQTLSKDSEGIPCYSMTISTKLRGVSPFTFQPRPCDPRIWNHISHGIVALVFAGKVVDTFPAKALLKSMPIK